MDQSVRTLTPEIEVEATAAGSGARKKLLIALAGVVALAGAGYAAFDITVAAKHAATDNAYVDAETAEVTALTSGPVADVRVVDTQAVKKGDILVVLDDADRRLELEQAKAALGQALRKMQSIQANSGSLSGQIAARQADLIRAKAELQRAQVEYDRRHPLAGTGAISGEEMTTVKTNLEAAQAAFEQAQANLRAAQGAHEANDALIQGAPLDQNPEVAAARARVDQAEVALSRTVVRAPVDGIVTKRTVQVGQMVQPGALLMTVVPVQAAYVTANFKEVQLKKVRVGQKAELTSDLYGKDVVYHGRVVGFSGGTGAATAIVPAQNATGNWIKVVQRLPVRIALDPRELAAHPLKVGLSMDADINLAD
ncbi:HlyD family secretion protein [Phenylobacterium montanum]|uniref:HlyD family efflux transporter periplasmic adaptor subunit n=1 Tax=Phenylobacterium montanum TaxID=2823693 RepID=A0A975G3T3_9CAUL|nr:HlyD family efflux transporter periplasmic adaptor subunit [Caulobacter sp. S6]QUD90355.1 HlyD family efflux transporter periplasmic adaptor subunit [Caulobacter sp. S6]